MMNCNHFVLESTKRKFKYIFLFRGNWKGEEGWSPALVDADAAKMGGGMDAGGYPNGFLGLLL